MQHRFYHGFSTAVMTLLLISTVAHSKPSLHYSVTDLGEAEARAIEPTTNQVVGERLVRDPEGTLQLPAILGVGRGERALGLLPGGVFATPFAIRRLAGTDVVRIVGESGTGDFSLQTHAFRVDVTADQGGVELVDLGTTGGFDLASFARGVNAHGDIVGFGDSPDGAQIVPLLWTAGAEHPVPLPTLGGPNGFASAINNAGDICGNTETAEGEDHATCWLVGEDTPVDILASQPQELSLVLALTEDQTVGGIVLIRGQETRGFLWTKDAGAVLLPPLPGETRSRVDDINSSGVAVGTSGVQNPELQRLVETPIVYVNRKPLDLTDLADVPDDCEFERAVAISDDGHIVVQGTCGPQTIFHVFLLTPDDGPKKSRQPKHPRRVRPANPSAAFDSALRAAKLSPDVVAVLQARHRALAQKLMDRAAQMQ